MNTWANVISTALFNAQPSAFAVAISAGRVINAIRSNDCNARFCNDARDTSFSNNCMLLSDRQYRLHYAEPRYHRGSGSRVCLMTSRAVVAGEELLVSYGAKAYWEAIA